MDSTAKMKPTRILSRTMADFAASVTGEWTLIAEDAPFDGPYLMRIERTEECGNVTVHHRVVQNVKNEWQHVGLADRMTAWMPIPPYAPNQDPGETAGDEHCPGCGHQSHGTVCLNMAPDNECDCEYDVYTGTIPETTIA